MLNDDTTEAQSVEEVIMMKVKGQGLSGIGVGITNSFLYV